MEPSDIHALFKKFKLRQIWVVKKDDFYAKKLLEVTRVDLTGVSFIDMNEVVGNRLSTQTKYCFGWPAINWYLAKDLLRKKQDVK